MSDWNRLCIEKSIPCSEKFSLASTLGNPMQIRAWSLAGLPSDNFSVENGIIVTNANRYPLLIDPQGKCWLAWRLVAHPFCFLVQANKWIKTMEKDNSLKVIKQSDDNYMRVLEIAITYGNPVLLENVGKLDRSRTTLILFRIVHQPLMFLIGRYFIVIKVNLHNFVKHHLNCLVTWPRKPSSYVPNR